MTRPSRLLGSMRRTASSMRRSGWRWRTLPKVSTLSPPGCRNAEAKLRAVLEFSKTLGRALDLQEVLDKILDGLFKVFSQSEEGAVLLTDDNSNNLSMRSSKIKSGRSDRHVPLSMTVIRRAIDNDEAILITDSAEDARFKSSESIKGMKARSIMCVPLLGQSGNSLGAIQLNTKHPLSQFSKDDLDVMTSVAAQAGLAIQNSHLHEKVSRLSEEMCHAARLSAVGEMSAGIAHDLHQPLAVIANYASGCERRLKHAPFDSHALLESVQAINSEALRAGDILRSVRKFIRKREIVREPVNLNDVVKDAQRLVASTSRQSQTSIKTVLADNLSNVFADRIQLTQVMVNLLLNAIEAMAQGEGSGRQITVATCTDESSNVQASVADTGPGIPPELSEKVLDQFFTTKPEGLGIGLSISRSIIEHHGGRIWLTSKPGQGCTFLFVLPNAEPRTG